MAFVSSPPPDLEPRFSKPEGWQWGAFKREGRDIRFGYAFPQNTPKAVIVCLPGLSEYIEKYFETAQDFLARDCGVFVIDWMGQGASGRYLPNLFKRHSDGFEKDRDDLHHLITDYIQPAIHEKFGQPLPLVMLGHSMGGHIGARYLEKYDGVFAGAGMTAPLFGIYQFATFPKTLISLLAKTLNALALTRYAFGQKDWFPLSRPKPGSDEFSSDPKRGALQCAWWDQNPPLRLGGVTFGWIHDALQSCRDISPKLKTIQTPILIALAEKDVIVDNQSIHNACQTLPNARMISLENAKHEILMETDGIRDKFLNEFYDFVDSVIDEKSNSSEPE